MLAQASGPRHDFERRRTELESNEVKPKRRAMNPTLGTPAARITRVKVLAS